MNTPSNESLPESIETPKKRLVTGLLIKDGKLLLIENLKETNDPEKQKLRSKGVRLESFGGKPDPHPTESRMETDEEALEREADEELGVKINVLKKIGSYPTHCKDGEYDVATYLCDITEGTPQEGREPGKMGAIKYYSLNELRAMAADPESGLVPNLRAALGDIERLLQ